MDAAVVCWKKLRDVLTPLVPLVCAAYVILAIDAFHSCQGQTD